METETVVKLHSWTGIIGAKELICIIDYLKLKNYFLEDKNLPLIKHIYLQYIVLN